MLSLSSVCSNNRKIKLYFEATLGINSKGFTYFSRRWQLVCGWEKRTNMQTKKGFVSVLLSSSQPDRISVSAAQQSSGKCCSACICPNSGPSVPLTQPGRSTGQRQGSCGGVVGKAGDLLQSLEFRKGFIVGLKRKKEKLEFSHPELATHRGLQELTMWAQCNQSRPDMVGYEGGCTRAVPMTQRLNKRSKYFLSRKHEIVDFRSSQFSEKTSTLQTEKQSFTQPKTEWDETVLSAVWQPGWERGLAGTGYMHTYGWTASLFTWNYHYIVC